MNSSLDNMRSFSFCFLGYIILVFILILCSDSIYPIMDLNKERISFTVLGDSGLPFFPSFNKEAVNNSTCLVFNSFAFISLKYGNK